MTTSRPAQAAPEAVGADDSAEAWGLAHTLIHSRRTISSRRLRAPGPDPAQLQELLQLAAAAPDHGQLTPWRFVIIPPDQRHRLGEVFAQALADRDPQATVQQLAAAHEKAHRAPLLMVAIACLGVREPDTPALERMVSMGAAIQNLLLGAHAMGFGTGLTSGKAMASTRLHRLLGLSQAEAPVCCINIGHAETAKPLQRPRPDPAQFVSTLGRP